MSQATPDQLKLIDVRSPLLRALLVVPVALALLCSWYAVRWYVGDFVAEFAPQMEEGQLDAAQAAMNLAPDDPWTHWVVAGLRKRTLVPEDLVEAVHQYEEAVRLSPNDYRFWVDLGRTREETGDIAGGEKALRRAVELAPAYASPRWYLGNLLLRAGRGEEAFAELRRAAEADPKFRPQLFNVAWSLYAQDVEAIKKVVGESPAARAEFAIYLVGRQRLDDALGLWSSLQPAEKKEQSAAGAKIMQALLEQKNYRTALSVFGDLNPELDLQAGQIINGGFESDIEAEGSSPFSWQIKSDPKALIAIDASTHHSGARSLRILFNATTTLSFSNVSQLVVVRPATDYRLEFYVQAETLNSAGTPLVVVQDIADGAVLGTSEAAAPGTYPWQPLAVNFKTSAKTEAIQVRIDRAQCSGAAVCPILGTIWYDDFNLQSVGGATGPRDGRKAIKAGP